MITLDKIDSGIDSGSSPELLHDEQPMSRTLQYRKVMKPLLERKRRARINKCLDDLKVSDEPPLLLTFHSFFGRT